MMLTRRGSVTFPLVPIGTLIGILDHTDIATTLLWISMPYAQAKNSPTVSLMSIKVAFECCASEESQLPSRWIRIRRLCKLKGVSYKLDGMGGIFPY